MESPGIACQSPSNRKRGRKLELSGLKKSPNRVLRSNIPRSRRRVPDRTSAGFKPSPKKQSLIIASINTRRIQSSNSPLQNTPTTSTSSSGDLPSREPNLLNPAENCENFSPTENDSMPPKTPKSSTTVNAIRSPVQAMLRQLQSDLSPKYISPSTPSSSVRCSRYGRAHKTKESTDFVDPDVAVKKSNAVNSASPPKKLKNIKTNSAEDLLGLYNVDLKRSPTSRKDYISPIQSLILKNKVVRDVIEKTGNSPTNLTLGSDYDRKVQMKSNSVSSDVANVIVAKNTRLITERASRVSPQNTNKLVDFEMAIERSTILKPTKTAETTKKASLQSRRINIPMPPLFSEAPTTAVFLEKLDFSPMSPIKAARKFVSPTNSPTKASPKKLLTPDVSPQIILSDLKDLKKPSNTTETTTTEFEYFLNKDETSPTTEAFKDSKTFTLTPSLQKKSPRLSRSPVKSPFNSPKNSRKTCSSMELHQLSKCSVLLNKFTNQLTKNTSSGQISEQKPNASSPKAGVSSPQKCNVSSPRKVETLQGEIPTEVILDEKPYIELQQLRGSCSVLLNQLPKNTRSGRITEQKQLCDVSSFPKDDVWSPKNCDVKSPLNGKTVQCKIQNETLQEEMSSMKINQLRGPCSVLQDNLTNPLINNTNSGQKPPMDVLFSPKRDVSSPTSQRGESVQSEIQTDTHKEEMPLTPEQDLLATNNNVCSPIDIRSTKQPQAQSTILPSKISEEGSNLAKILFSDKPLLLSHEKQNNETNINLVKLDCVQESADIPSLIKHDETPRTKTPIKLSQEKVYSPLKHDKNDETPPTKTPIKLTHENVNSPLKHDTLKTNDNTQMAFQQKIHLTQSDSIPTTVAASPRKITNSPKIRNHLVLRCITPSKTTMQLNNQASRNVLGTTLKKCSSPTKLESPIKPTIRTYSNRQKMTPPKLTLSPDNSILPAQNCPASKSPVSNSQAYNSPVSQSTAPNTFHKSPTSKSSAPNPPYAETEGLKSTSAKSTQSDSPQKRDISPSKTPNHIQSEIFKKPSPKPVMRRKTLTQLATVVSPKHTSIPTSNDDAIPVENAVDFLINKYPVSPKVVPKHRRSLLSLGKPNAQESIGIAALPYVHGKSEDLSQEDVQVTNAQADDRMDVDAVDVTTAKVLSAVEVDLESDYTSEKLTDTSCVPTHFEATHKEEKSGTLTENLLDTELKSDVISKRGIDTYCLKDVTHSEATHKEEETIYLLKTPVDPKQSHNSSFEGDTCPSVSSEDSAKGSSITDEDPSNKIDDIYQVGDLAWARIGNYPYWPCLVCNSPEGLHTSFTTGKKPQRRIHIRFLADNGRRSWTSPKCMMPFKSIDDFEAKKRELPSNIKSKDPRLRALTVNSGKIILWSQAILEAEMLAVFPHDRRPIILEKKLDEDTNPTQPQVITEKRFSTTSQDSFDSLLADSVSRNNTSTPCITSPMQSYATCDPQEIRMLSRSPTPESPEYEELSIELPHSDGNETDTKIHNYLLSISNDGSTSPVPEHAEPNEAPTDEDLTNVDVSENLEKIAKTKEFLEYYRNTKHQFISDCDTRTEAHLKHLALKMYALQTIEITTTNKRGRGRTKKSDEPVAKRKKSDDEVLADQIRLASVRKSSRMSMAEYKAKRVSDADQEMCKQKESKDTEELEAQAAAKAAAWAARVAERNRRELEEMSKYFMKEYPKNVLFKGLNKELVCRICHQTGELVKCHTSACNEHVHHLCAMDPEAAQARIKAMLKVNTKSKKVESRSMLMHVTGDMGPNLVEEDKLAIDMVNTLENSPAYCPDCVDTKEQVCFVCKTNNGTELKCTERLCGRQFHVACLKYWPQNKIVSDYHLLCPCHVCHTCISDDPRNKYHVIKGNNLIKCVKCPATYHIDSCCIPAGSQLLTSTQLICPRHRVEVRKPINANWCFICSRGGELVCCDTCPTAFHAECLRVPVPDTSYICEECETGRYPLYGEIVWAKIGSCKWWPAVVVPPSEIPDTINAVKRQPHNFAVRFFGARNYSWISRGFVFLYQEEDSDYTAVHDGKPDKVYERALVEAKEYAAKLREIGEKYADHEKDHLVKPLPYTKIKKNQPIPPVRIDDGGCEEDEERVCQCSRKDDDPCGPQSSCLNRALSIECDSATCPAGPDCQNQRFEKRLYPNVIARKTEGKGWGLVTLDDIPAGAFVIEYVGELINRKEFERRIQVMQQVKDEHYYFMTMTADLMIDAGPRGNAARFMNHSCEPNCETQVWLVNGNRRVGLFALADIPANTELTFNYNLECIGELKKICFCGANKCAGFIGAKFIEPSKPKFAATGIKKGRGRKRAETPHIKKKKSITQHASDQE